MLISDLQGLKFPDEYVIRFFFKEGLNRRKGNVLELGCGNGNNLMMFYQYGWKVFGVDNNELLIKKAKSNFSKCQTNYRLSETFQFFVKDMIEFAADYNRSSPSDVLLLSNSICYLDYRQIINLFFKIKENEIIKNNSSIFIRTRTPQDYRYGRGEKYGEKSFKLNIKETGEQGCLNTFLTKSELIAILEKVFDFEYKRIFYCRFDNYQMGHIVSNSDIILWGRISEIKE